MSKRVLIAINFDEGLYNFRKELVESLVERGHEVHLAMPYGEYTDRLVKMGCIFHDVPLNRRGTNPLQEIRLLGAYRKILKEVRPDSVLTYTIKPNVYCGGMCGLMGISYMPTITGLGTAVEGRGLLQSFTQLLYKLAMKKSHLIFFQNEDNKILFEKLGIGKKHKLISGSGVNLSRYALLPFNQKERPGFVYISRVMKEKGIDCLMDAAEHFADRADFTVLGFLEEDYENRDRFEDLVKRGIIKYPGSVEDVRPYLAESRALVHPSFYPEGMSNVCMEAASSGRAIITTDHNGCRQTVKNGETGLLVRPNDSADLIEKLEQFLSMSMEEQKQMGLAGRRFMEEVFDRRLVIGAYVKEIEALI